MNRKGIITGWVLSALLLTNLFSCKNKEQAGTEIIFDSIMITKQIPLLERNDSTLPFADVKIRFTYPSKFGSKKDLARLQQIFIGTFFGNTEIDTLSPSAAVETFIADYEEKYKALSNDYYYEKSRLPRGDSPVWYWYTVSIDNDILFRNDSLLSYGVNYSDYTGGAHGSHFTSYTNVNLGNLTTISEEDIFVPNYQKTLTGLILRKLIEKNGVTSADSLINLGFFNIEEIAPNNNFRIDEKGIHYAYNQYEIAPYSMGVIEVYLPYNELSDILIPNGFIEKLFLR